MTPPSGSQEGSETTGENVYFFRSRYSVIFVAFDKNHEGKIGSKRFISEYLIPQVLNKYGCRVQVGKIIIPARVLNLLVRLF